MPGPFIIAGLLMWLVISFDSNSADAGNEVSCVIQSHWWINPDKIIISWNVPESVHRRTLDEPLSFYVHWYTEYNIGNCTSSTMTSCISDYGYPNTMDFGSEFNISVSITTNEKDVVYEHEWMIDPLQCQKPPILDHAAITFTNSTCLGIAWAYKDATGCSSFSEKVYKISYRRTDQLNWKFAETTNFLCNGSYFISNLRPYTEYEIGVQCKTSYSHAPIGHWSDFKAFNITTKQYVPTVEKEFALSSYSYLDDMCPQNGTRTITIFWKDLKPELKNGVITHFVVRIFKLNNNGTRGFVRKYTTDGETLSCDATITCDSEYEILIRAATRIGSSDVFWRIAIPVHNESQINGVDVIPERDEEHENIVTVSWRVENTEETQFDNITVYSRTCGENVGICKYALNWTFVANNSMEITIVSPVPFHDSDIFGVAFGKRAITWSKCQYLKSEKMRIPRGLKVVPSISHARCLFLSWINKPCESVLPAPYTQNFVIHFCKVHLNHPLVCTDRENSVLVDGRDSTRVICDLDPDVRYKVDIVAVGIHNQSSLPSPGIHGIPYNRKIREITVILPVLVMFVTGGCFITFVHLMKKQYNKLKNKFHIKTIPISSESIELI